MSQQINLFNPIFLKQKKVFGAVPMLEALGVIVLGALVLGWLAQQRVSVLEQRAAAGKTMVAERETRLNKAAVQFAPRQRSATLDSEVAAAEAELNSLHQVDSVLHGGALGNTAGYAEYFRAFARQDVSGLWLTGVSIVGAGNDIGVQGRAMQATLIPNYIARLTAEKVMNGKTFGRLEIARPVAVLNAAAGTAAAAAAGAAVAAPPLAPYVEFSLQSQGAEAVK
ncbi:MSHA biogenesis protein MshA [Rugamonas sp.]|uniref:MSHA biogenesis protein MshA n=1 Tax=Rugamonas sp. TaxID=1926287 RepID=UPI0025F85C84|nr:MSHA biogenesis protein MshA [Rugamonas sp.]